MVTWIPSIYPSHVSIYTSTMDPMGIIKSPSSDFPKLRPSRTPKNRSKPQVGAEVTQGHHTAPVALGIPGEIVVNLRYHLVMTFTVRHGKSPFLI